MGKREQMSRKLDAWLGRGFKAYKLKALLGLTVSRLAVLRNQRRARCDHARGDVAEFLRQGQQERALLRAEYVVKEQNMMDAFDMVERYCHVVTERTTLLENQKDCPEELREAIAGLLFAQSRCGELPELHEVRSIFVSKLGKEFVAAAVELRNNCSVNPKIIQKMSTKAASLESRTKVTKDIAAELGITLHLEEPSSELATPTTPNQPAAAADDVSGLAGDEYFSESTQMRQRYKDAASAAQAAFESAAYAAAAARAAVELSKSESLGRGGTGDQSSSPHVPSRTTSGVRSRPLQSWSSEMESEQGMKQGSQPVQLPGEARYASPPGSKRDDLLRVTDKTIAYDTDEEEDESEEEGGGGELMRNPAGPMQSRALESGDPPGHGFRGRQQVDVSSEEDRSDEEMEEIRPQTATYGWRSPERRQGSWERSQDQEPYKAEYRYRKEEQEEEEEPPAAPRHGTSMVGNAGIGAGDSAPVHKLGVWNGPISMRTRRSVF